MAAVSAHPLDPLAADEIRAAAAILRRDHGVGERWRIRLDRAARAAQGRRARAPAGDPIAREATVICWNRDDGRVYKARVDLAGDRTTAWDHVPDGQPNMTVDEFKECDAALRRDPRVIKALADRGITDMDRVLIDTWAYGAHLVPEQHRGGRIGWADVWYRKQPGSSPYANPVTGLHFVVDLNRMELLEVEDDHRVEEPETMGEYVPHLVPGLRLRDDVERLEITQPEGASYTVDGHLVRWQKWSVRVGFNHREGMVLHTLAYDGRPVAHRLSFAEMVVPYRDPTTDHYRRTAFDVGEWGLGFMTTSLELGCDCLGEIAYLDAVMHDTQGRAVHDPQRDLHSTSMLAGLNLSSSAWTIVTSGCFRKSRISISSANSGFSKPRETIGNLGHEDREQEDMRDIDLPGALEDARAGDQRAALAHRAAVHEGGGIAGDEDEDFGGVAEAVIADGDPADDVGRDMVEKDQPERDPTEQVEPQIALGWDRRGRDRVGHRRGSRLGLAGPGQIELLPRLELRSQQHPRACRHAISHIVWRSSPGLLKWPIRQFSMYSAVTRNIEVKVTPRFLAERSSPDNGYFFWAYTIAITNHGAETVQLKTRHWRITDANGRLQEVRGAGVVGEEPVLSPGSRSNTPAGYRCRRPRASWSAPTAW